MTKQVVVSVDGSPAAVSALSWAARMAPGAKDVESSPTVRLALEGVTDGHPLTERCASGGVVVELLTTAVDADLLVVGSRGRSRGGSPLGSDSRACLAHAACLVAVGRQAPQGRVFGRVIVRVDGSVHARARLLLGAQEARLRGASPQTLHKSPAARSSCWCSTARTPTSSSLVPGAHPRSRPCDGEVATPRTTADAAQTAGD